MIAIYFLLAFAFSTVLHLGNPYLTDDGTNYLRIAQNLFAGKGISINPGEAYLLNPPFYSVLIGLFAKLPFGGLEFWGSFVSTLSFALTLFPLFFLVRSLYGPKAAHWTCLLYLTNGFLLVYSPLVLSEPLFIFLLMLLLYQAHLLLQEEKPSLLSGVLLGLTGGLAYLTRPEGFLFFGASVFVILFFSPAPYRSRLRVLLPSLAAFLVFLLPYFQMTYQKTGHWQLSGGVVPEMIRRTLDVTRPGQYLEVKKIIEGLSTDKTGLRVDELAHEFNLVGFLTSQGFVALLRSIPLALFSRVVEFNKYFFGGLGFFFVGAGFLGAAWDERRKRSEILLFSFLLPFFVHFFVVFDVRRYLPLYPIFLIWMGGGMEVMRNWAQKSFGLGPKRSQALVLGLCLALALPSFGYLRRSSRTTTFPFEHREMGLWMKEHIPQIEEETVVTHRPFAAFYSGGRYAWLPYVDRFEDLLTYMHHLKARYFVVADDLDTPVLDSYRFLLDETKDPPPTVKRVHIVHGVHQVILYEIPA